MKYSLLILLLLVGNAAATCQTFYDYCWTFNLPEGADVTEFYSTPSTDILAATNIQGEFYLDQNLQTIYVNVSNGASTKVWEGWNAVTAGISAQHYLYFNSSGAIPPAGVKSNVTVCLNGSDTIDLLPDATLISYPVGAGFSEMSLDKFAEYYRREWTFKDNNNQVFNFTNTTAVLNAWCDTYSQVSLNLTDVVGDDGVLTVQTLEQPKFFLYYEDNLPRIRQDRVNFLLDNYYISSTPGANYTFTLVDYTGGECYQSYLSILSNINDVIGKVHVQQFDQSNIQYANLEPEMQYTFNVDCTTSFRNLGPVYLDGVNVDRNVVVSNPTLNPLASRWDGLNISISSNYNTVLVTCVVGSTSLTDVSFLLYSTNTTPYTLIGEENASDVLTATLSQAGNRSLQYYADCYTSDTTYGVRERTQLINFQNSSLYYGGFGTLTLPDTIFGLSKTRFLNLTSVSIALIVAGLFSAISMGTGAVVFGMTIGLFYYIGYFITSPMTIGLIIFLGIMIKVSENRFGVVT